MNAVFNDKVIRATVNTGNILSLNNITKNPGINPTDELVQTITATLEEWKENPEKIEGGSAEYVLVRRGQKELETRIAEHERKDLKIGLKLFVSIVSEKVIQEAIDRVFTALNVQTFDNLVVSYHHPTAETVINNSDLLDNLKQLWKILQKYVKEEKICQIGLADIDESQFRSIFEWADIKPSIIQINLATCCVVPQTLTNFCKDNEIQLLTHSDPTEILPKDKLATIFGTDNQVKTRFALRYLVHIKCRGVLTTKGYITSFGRENDNDD